MIGGAIVVWLAVLGGGGLSPLSLPVLVAVPGPGLALFFAFLAIYDRFCPTPGLCRACDYDLRVNESRHCPECGCPRYCEASGHDLSGVRSLHCGECGARVPLSWGSASSERP